MNLTLRDLSQRLALPLVLIAFVLISLMYSVIVPLGEAPDEVSHWSYVQYLTTHQRLPIAEGPVAGEAHQPPLYYLLGGFVSFWVPDQQFESYANPDWYLGNSETPNLLLHTRRESFPYQGGALAWHLVRLVSVVLGAITVWATYRLAQEVFPKNQWLALTAAAFVAFLPQFTFLSAVVNSDNLVITLSALGLLVFFRSARDTRPITFAVLGVLLGLAILAKVSAIALWAAIGFALLIRRQWLSLGERLGRIALTFALAAAIGGSWIIYNFVAFGDPILYARMVNGFPRTEAMTWADWITYGERMYWSFLGKFGGVTNVGMPLATYAALTMLIGVGMIGVFLLFRDLRTNRLSSIAREALITIGLFDILLVVLHMRLETAVLGIDQARQVFAGVPPFGLLVAAGILRLARRPAAPALIVVCGMGLIGLTNAFAVASAYAPGIQLASITAPSSPRMDFGQQIRVLAYRVDPLQVVPGDAVVVEIEWQALKDVTENHWLLLRLGDSVDPILNKEGVPSGGRLTTDWWQKGQVLTSHHIFVVPKDTAPGTYALWLGLHPFGKWEWLPVGGGEMLPLGKIKVTGNP